MSSRHRPAAPRGGAHGRSGHVPGQAGLPEDTGARGLHRILRGGAAALRGARARRLQPPLRLPPRGGRRPGVVGGAEGPVDRPAREATGHPHRGPSGRLSRLRGSDPGGGVRRGLGDRVGRGHLRQPVAPRRRGIRRGGHPGWARHLPSLPWAPRAGTIVPDLGSRPRSVPNLSSPAQGWHHAFPVSATLRAVRAARGCPGERWNGWS